MAQLALLASLEGEPPTLLGALLGWFGFGWLNQRGRRTLLEVLLLDVGCVVLESQASVLMPSEESKGPSRPPTSTATRL